MDDLVFSPKKINLLVKEGADIVFTPEAEKAINTLLEMEDRIMEAKALLKQKIIEKGRSLYKDFHGVKGNTIKTYIKTNDKYTLDRTKKPKLQNFLKTISFQKLDQEKVKEYVSRNKSLPDGISENKISETLVIMKNEQAE